MNKEYLGAITYKYGRKQNDIFTLSFCPFCGGNIREEKINISDDG